MLSKFNIGAAAWTPPRVRSPAAQDGLPLPLNLLFAFASTITAANLYYIYPVLNKVAEDFEISYEHAALVPTLLQAGYGSGIFFLCTLGDRYRLRPIILALITFAAVDWLCLCLITNFNAFCAMSFVTGFASVTPQFMIPMVSALVPPHRRAEAISIVFSGLMLGSLLPRFLSGVIAQFTVWRNIYWAALGLQALVFGLLWWFMPDYPAPASAELRYFPALWSTVQLVTTQPVLAYACLMVFFSNAVFASYWTTLTALLSSTPYSYTPIQIGAFALIGIAPLICVPFYSRFVIDRFVPNFSVMLGLLYAVCGVLVGTFTAELSFAGPIIQAIGVDFGVQTASVAYRAAIYSSIPEARNRTNVAYTVAAFIGQLSGTSIGNRLYAIGGWSKAGIFNIAFLAAAIAVTTLRGPWETKWLGWRGGFNIRRRDLDHELSVIEARQG